MDTIQSGDLVLVAIIKARRDLEIARVLGWYRIPVQTAPKTLRVDWIAFYLTGAFGDQKWSIRYAAPVRGFELTRRRDLLREETAHMRADAPYFKLQLGPLLTLPEPIPAQRWRRFTFLYTTGERLLAAREMRDLRILDSGTRKRLWGMLKERIGE
ncbi:MAG: hypothetical protein JXA97_04740 [Anaerolineales bacterium]|nr:hypothetical protein [Anaerolineales bacterium]